MYKYIDIHSHLNDPRFDSDLPETLTRMREASVASIVVGTDRAMSERAVKLAEEHSDLWASVGQHPTDKHDEVFDLTIYRKLAAHSKVVAIGECGLDYYWPEHDKWPDGAAKEKARQRELFEQQITLARELNKPLMIHGRPTKGTMDAYQDILAILKGHDGVRGNIHFFVGDKAIAKQFLDIGFTMSFTGVLTFTHDYDEVIRYIPLDRMMSETDAPYVAPVPHRGKRNEPAFVTETVAVIARIRNEAPEHVREVLVNTAFQEFHL